MSNLNKDLLKGKDIAVYFGTFAPLHKGHRDIINKAKRLHDGVVVVTSGYDGDRGSLIGLNLNKRFRYLRETFADDDLVFVSKLDETGMPPMPSGWDSWTEKLLEIALNSIKDINAKLTFYVGEPEYVTELTKRIPKRYDVSLMDRCIINISATEIRNNPLKHWDKISRVYRRHFSKNILVVGSASGGKTTLVKDLARFFESPFSLEYARSYQEKYNVKDSELDVWDYLRLLQGQYTQTGNIINSPSNNGLVFADTNSTVTDVYGEYDLTDEEYNNVFKPMVTQLAEQEKWDLILVIPPVTKYVNDGFRNMNQSNEEFRWEFHNKLMDKLIENGWEDKIVLLDGKPSKKDPQGFYARYEQAKEVIVNKFGLNNM